MRRTATLLMLAAALAACSATTPARQRPNPARLLVEPGSVLAIGDSILVGARDEGGLVDLLADAGWEAEVVAEGSRQVSWALYQVEAREDVPRTVVVVLGSNPGAGVGTFPEEATTLIDALRARGARRILWIPPHALDGRYADKQAALRELEGRVVDVLDWPAALDPHPEWYQGDGLHLTSDGYEALALFLRDALTRR